MSSTAGLDAFLTVYVISSPSPKTANRRTTTSTVPLLMYERKAFGSRVVPANSIAKMHARFLPLLTLILQVQVLHVGPIFENSL